MTAPVARQQLGASTGNRKWYLDVDTADSSSAPNWIGVFGVTDLVPGGIDATLEDDSDFEGRGFKSQTKTAEGWMVEATLARKVQAALASAYDPGQEFLRAKSSGKFGQANSVHVRWYEMEPGGPRVEAYEGWAAVVWSPEGGPMSALSKVKVTLTGQGERLSVAHPGDLVPQVPTVASVSPSSGPTAGGTLVTIKGRHFTGTVGATGVKVGGVNATSYQVIDDQTISAVIPAGTAGAKQVVVTNAVGASTSAVNFTYV